MRTARAIIEKTGFLDVLSYASATEKKLDVPSWTPDWSMMPRLLPLKERTSLPLNDRHRNKHLYRASGDSKSALQSASDPRVLTLSGFTVDKVTVVGPAVTEQDGDLSAAAANCVFQWSAMTGAIENQEQPYVGGGVIIDAIQHTIIAGMSAFPAQSSQPTRPTSYDVAAFWHW